jgi:hypothetical protein
MTEEEKRLYQREYEEYLDRMGFDNYVKKTRLSPITLKLFESAGIQVQVKDKTE